MPWLCDGTAAGGWRNNRWRCMASPTLVEWLTFYCCGSTPTCFTLQGLVRVYTKKTGSKPDFGDPVVLRWAGGLAGSAGQAVGQAGRDWTERLLEALHPPSILDKCCPTHLGTCTLSGCAPTLLPCSEDRGGTNMQHFCQRLHKNLIKEYQYGLVWGTSSKHMPQR